VAGRQTCPPQPLLSHSLPEAEERAMHANYGMVGHPLQSCTIFRKGLPGTGDSAVTSHSQQVATPSHTVGQVAAAPGVWAGSTAGEAPLSQVMTS
jgi:hypothetical protein